jgi:integrase
MTVGQWQAVWWPTWAVEDTTRATAAGRWARYLLPAWERVELRGVSTFRVQAWAADLGAAGVGRETVRGCVRLLSSLCAGAMRAGVITANPCLGVRLPPVARRAPRFLTRPEVAQVAAGLPPPFARMCTVAAYTGLRWGELAGLHAHRVDLARGRLEVVETLTEVNGRLSVKAYPKSSSSRREVPLARAALGALGEPAGTGLVFVNSRGGALSRSNVRQRAWHDAVAGLPEPRPRWHDLRHTAASWMIQAGVHPVQVQRVLGHSSITVTMVYAHLAPGAFDDVLAALDD